jgi:hypothetical protein
MRNEVVMAQSIPFHKQNKKIKKSEKCIISGTKHPISFNLSNQFVVKLYLISIIIIKTFDMIITKLQLDGRK